MFCERLAFLGGFEVMFSSCCWEMTYLSTCPPMGYWRSEVEVALQRVRTFNFSLVGHLLESNVKLERGGFGRLSESFFG